MGVDIVTKNPRHTPLAKPQNLTTSLIKALAKDIVSGHLKPGEQIPTENELSQKFEVSRTVVREAVAALKSDGLLISRQGRGVFVANDGRNRSLRISDAELASIQDVQHILELRQSLEVEAAGFAAERRSQTEMRAISTSLEALSTIAGTSGDGVSEDFVFHRQIAVASGNPYYPKFLDFIGGHIIPRMRVKIGGGSEAELADYLEKINAEHQAIHQSILEQNVRMARQAMRAHLSNGQRRLRKHS